MPDKMVALVGPGTGPLMHTSRMGQLLVKLRELTDGEVRIQVDGTPLDCFYVSDMEFVLPAADTIQVLYTGRSKRFMCLLEAHPHALQCN